MIKNEQLQELDVSTDNAKGSVELIVIGLIAALIIVLAIPILADIGTKTEQNLQEVNEQL